MADFRIDTGFFRHVKTKKLRRILGLDGVFALQALWAYAAENKHGCEKVYTDEDIEIVTDWESNGGPGIAETLAAVGYLNEVPGGYKLHQWSEHNGYAATAEQRKLIARSAAEARWKKRRGDVLPEDIEGNQGDNADDMHEHMHAAMPSIEISNAPSPSPSPSPSLKEQTSSLRSEVSAEPCQGTTQAEPDPAPERGEPEFEILLSGKNPKPFAAYADDVAEWELTFPGIDVRQELRKIRQWARDNPTRRKTAAGIRRHISAWLAKAQDRSGGMNARSPDAPHASKTSCRAPTQAQKVSVQRDVFAQRLLEESGLTALNLGIWQNEGGRHVGVDRDGCLNAEKNDGCLGH